MAVSESGGQDSGEVYLAEVYDEAARDLAEHGPPAGHVGKWFCGRCGEAHPCARYGTAQMLLDRRRGHLPASHPNE